MAEKSKSLIKQIDGVESMIERARSASTEVACAPSCVLTGTLYQPWMRTELERRFKSRSLELTFVGDAFVIITALRREV